MSEAFALLPPADLKIMHAGLLKAAQEHFNAANTSRSERARQFNADRAADLARLCKTIEPFLLRDASTVRSDGIPPNNKVREQ